MVVQGKKKGKGKLRGGEIRDGNDGEEYRSGRREGEMFSMSAGDRLAYRCTSALGIATH